MHFMTVARFYYLCIYIVLWAIIRVPDLQLLIKKALVVKNFRTTLRGAYLFSHWFDKSLLPDYNLH